MSSDCKKEVQSNSPISPVLKRRKLNSEEDSEISRANSSNTVPQTENLPENNNFSSKNSTQNSSNQKQQQQEKQANNNLVKNKTSNSTTKMSNGGDENKSQEIDEGLYSRQLYVLGHEAMKKMAVSDVLISGLDGLGVEVAKNVILAGVKSVTLHDTANCTIKDLSSQYYLSESSIGKNRAVESCNHLSELNNYVPTSSYAGELTEEFLQQFRVVVLTQNNEAEHKRISDICRKYNIALIVCLTSGLFGQIFCDFGPEFTVFDINGANPLSAMIAGISKDKESVVTCLDESRHGFEDGDYVTFTEVIAADNILILIFFSFSKKYRSSFLSILQHNDE